MTILNLKILKRKNVMKKRREFVWSVMNLVLSLHSSAIWIIKKMVRKQHNFFKCVFPLKNIINLYNLITHCRFPYNFFFVTSQKFPVLYITLVHLTIPASLSPFCLCPCCVSHQQMSASHGCQGRRVFFTDRWFAHSVTWLQSWLCPVARQPLWRPTGHSGTHKIGMLAELPLLPF